ncbi:Trypsin [Nonomuraea solani]|uniref:Trypsin n=1 Tax=Nonomuraea solani TaxID=1144553 RepID=A0A1H6EBN0_9ACTN|nr:trypsin-like serine protease [Nonomuraea solani]SEG94673.1 Trypsin [Nonomuraea solani]
MIPRVRRIVAAALGGALLVLPAFTGIAHAAPASKVYPIPLTKSLSDVKRVADYWKPDRLKNSDTYSPATPGAATPTSSAAATSAPGVPVAAIKRATAAQGVAPVPPRKGATAATMGKVFFRIGGKEFWCSAASVAARNRSVVATAGHCAYDPRQAKAAEYWIFVPNPGPNGETPEGIYVGASINLHEDWSGKGDYDYDYAFVTVHRGFTWVARDGGFVMKDVGRLQDNVGGLGIELNKKPGTYTVAAYGYPAGAQPDRTTPFDGKTLRECPERTTRFTVAPARDVQKGVELTPCDFTEGASGGPWVIGWNKSSRLGSLNGVNSLTWNPGTNTRINAVSSPYFDTTAGEIYRHAAALTTITSVT